ncbi:MAG: DNA translocase FtsK [Desulfobacterales bacterium]|nr:DNA translocase FtsK [Desulfobacterales bacterium]
MKPLFAANPGQRTLQKEILGILCFFLVIFSLVSLMSYHPSDPGFNHAADWGRVHNFFGVAGAFAAGLMLDLFGVGAFWIPVFLLMASLRFYTHDSALSPWLMASGAILLIVGTGALSSLFKDSYLIFQTPYPAGGILGYPMMAVFEKYANRSGAMLIFAVMLAIGFIMATGISLVAVSRNALRLTVLLSAGIRNRVLKLLSGAAGLCKAVVNRPGRADQKKKPAAAARAYKPEKASKPEQIPPPAASAAPKPEERPDTAKTDAKGPALKKIPGKSDDIKIQAPAPPTLAPQPAFRQQEFESMQLEQGFQLPPLDFLEDAEKIKDGVDHEHLRQQSALLEQKLKDFGVQGNVTEVLPGPVITRYEFAPAPGVKINKIVNLSDDLALALKALSVRIVAPIPGKAVVGIEVPNKKRELVGFKDIIGSSVYKKSGSRLTIALGKDIVGYPVVADLEGMPHLLIAGATGTGKSVALNTMIASILFKATPEEVKLIMIDPKRIELSNYDGIPHLIAPVVTDMKKATNSLFWAVREMERRYKLLSEKKVRNIKQYNARIEKEKPEEGQPPPEKLPYIVVIVDELADLMMVSSRDVEVSLTRLAQMARAAGIHLILATQRPSVDVLTGLIKANFPTRLSFQVSSKIDSRTIIDINGAESLLGNGDMLFLPPGTAKLQRIHGAYVSEDEVTRVIEFLKSQKAPEYDHEVIEAPEPDKEQNGEQDYDERYDEAVALVTKTGQASISMVQRHLRIGYNRAARMIEVMEKEGVVGPSDGVKPREVLVRNDYDHMP